MYGGMTRNELRGLLALIVLAVAAVLIVSPLLQRAAAKRTAPAEAPGGRDAG